MTGKQSATRDDPTVEPTRRLGGWIATLRYADLPLDVVDATERLFVDWLGCSLAGISERPAATIAGLAIEMGPRGGPCQVLGNRSWTSPLFAALVNAAASHALEQDDVHNESVFHPATVVFPAALAQAQAARADGRRLIVAAVAGYEVGVRVGRALGRGHYRVFHTTGTAGTLAAAAATAAVGKAAAEQVVHALGTAGTQAAGLWEFLRDAGDSKQLHAAKAASDGLMATTLAMRGFTGATRIIDGRQGMAAGMLGNGDIAELDRDLGCRWAVLETSMKYHAACRHIHPAADALKLLVERERLDPAAIVAVRPRVHQTAIDVLRPIGYPETPHQAKFSMGFVLALIAHTGQAAVGDFSAEAIAQEHLRSFANRVEMSLDAEVDEMYPARWIGKIEVDLADGRTLNQRVEVPLGDPGNPLSREQIEEKFRRLTVMSGAASPEESDRLLGLGWGFRELEDVGAVSL